MIQRHIFLVCDAVDGTCGEESDHEMTETAARRSARKAGWQVGRNRQDPDFCPWHKGPAS